MAIRLAVSLSLAPVTSAVLLPIGFSFYILQAIAYLVDLSRNPKLAAASLADFGTLPGLLPQTALRPNRTPGGLSGPTCQRTQCRQRQPRARTGADSDRPAAQNRHRRPLRLFLAPDLFAKPAEFVFSEKLLGLFLFAFILYNDFAGYSAIVRGVSLLFGIDLTVNFRQPFFANSFSDFWNRWHISLSAWLRDYIFFPLRRSMVKAKWPQGITILIPPMVTMLASGLWHGSYLSMLFWGGLHGLISFCRNLCSTDCSRKIKTSVKANLLVALCFFLTSLAWIPFGASSLGSAFIYFKSFLPPYHFAPLPDFFFFDLGFPLFLSLFIDWQEYRINNVDFFMQWKPALQAGALALVLLLLLLFSVSGTDLSGFVYQGF
jgi:alginate O-acetyltransferase complex protein AlgI